VQRNTRMAWQMAEWQAAQVVGRNNNRPLSNHHTGAPYCGLLTE